MNENLGYHPSHQTALEQYAEAVQIERWENETSPTIEEERAFEREHGHAWDDIPVRGWPGLVITRDAREVAQADAAAYLEGRIPSLITAESMEYAKPVDQAREEAYAEWDYAAEADESISRGGDEASI